ncbi:hypothetical protein MPER_11237 [Moniliophthora perniciosa FA553]|nr:hypothetical protein MPER_11237 [Moniliophthora perniciosa FA553]
MSSEKLNPERNSSFKASRRSPRTKPPDPAQVCSKLSLILESISTPNKIPLPPSPPASVQEEQTSRKASTRPADEEKTKEKGAKKPTLDESWEKVLKEVARHDEDMVKGWRDDIDTLLVFAGLFSAVVKAFVIASYQWLDGNPADTTVTLLTYLITVQASGSQVTSFDPTRFKSDASSIRINVFWFLSLILSLTSALFDLLCKQWVREHQRDTTIRTPGEALALRRVRRDSFEKWGASSFLSTLPILLEVALLLFFVGVLDLLWNRHRVPFAVWFVVIPFNAGLYSVTALLPTLTVPRNQRSDIEYRGFSRLSYQFICPYKAPQAWLVYQFSSTIIHPLLKIPAINNFLHEKARGFWDHIKSPTSDWSSFDLWVVRQLDQHVELPRFHGTFNLEGDELCAFEWAVAMFRDSPSMIPHLHIVDSPDEMIEIASRKSGEGREDNLTRRILGEDDSMNDPGPCQRTDTGIPSDSGGEGEEAGSIGTNGYGLRR